MGCDENLEPIKNECNVNIHPNDVYTFNGVDVLRNGFYFGSVVSEDDSFFKVEIKTCNENIKGQIMTIKK